MSWFWQVFGKIVANKIYNIENIYLFVIDSLYVLQLRSSLNVNVSDVAENTLCLMSKTAFWSKII